MLINSELQQKYNIKNKNYWIQLKVFILLKEFALNTFISSSVQVSVFSMQFILKSPNWYEELALSKT
jgi:hypothetical protein